MRSKYGFQTILAVLAVCVFILGCETGDLEYEGTGDASVDAPAPDAPYDYVPDVPPEVPLADVPVDTPPPDLPPDLLPDMAPDLPPDLPPDITVPDMEEEEESPPPPECPGAPYGTRIGDRIADLSFPTSDGTTVSLCDYFRDITRKLLLVYDATGW